MSTLFLQKNLKINQIRPLEAKFTEVLDLIALKPEMLYFYGKIPKNVPSVAIVGARKCTSYGREQAWKLAYELTKAGAVVVSGLAYGIDAEAARGAVEAGGATVAVLGTAIDHIYPPQNQGLAEEILAKGGCIMSEYGPGAAPIMRTSFLMRNRLISGLAQAVIVVEAADHSGSLNTAGHALEQGRELFAVPGDVTRPLSVGTNRLIQQGAVPVLELDDVLRVLFPERFTKTGRPRKAKVLTGDTEEETAILRSICDGVTDGEAIVQRCGLDAALFNRTITLLEIKGRVRALGMNNWSVR